MLFRILVVIVLFSGCFRVVAADVPGALREVYLLPNGGGSIAGLTNSPSFPGSPNTESIVTTLEGPENYADNYGQRIRALLIPPTNGTYTFWIAGDDQSALYLSTDDQPANRRLIATVAAWTSFREWTKETNQQSAPITLEAGKRYFIEAQQSEGGGGDHVSVRWQIPGGVFEGPIPSSRLVVYGLGPPAILVQPSNTTAVEGQKVNFSVQLERMIGSGFQWFRGGVLISGATSNLLTLGPLSLADSNSVYRCAITNSLGGVVTTNATLRVLPDTTPPTLSAVSHLGAPNIILVQFSESVDPVTAGQATNYLVSAGVVVTSARVMPDGFSVSLNTSGMTSGSAYNVTVRNVRDRAATSNSISAGAQLGFVFNYTPLPVERIKGGREPIGPISRRTALAISEIMYHPPSRTDGRNLEFIEIYNSQEWPEDLSGYRLSGDVGYVFPTNTLMPARGFLVVAAVPADLQAAAGVSTPHAFTGSLPIDRGTIRLRNNQDAVLVEVNYDSDPPWPLAADGGGHSLVAARPSYGSQDPRTWAASDRAGGSPGADDPVTTNPLAPILINEFLAHTDDPQLDFIELFNYGTNALNLAGCILTDDVSTNRFVIPSGTVIAARGFVTFDQNQLGFSLNAAGEDLFLFNPDRSRVLDSVRFKGQENGVSTGRYPDGAPEFARLASPTPAAANAAIRSRDLVLSEIMYDPISGDQAEEFLELQNRTGNAIDLAGWRISGGADFTFPPGAMVTPSGRVVVAKDRTRLLTLYPSIQPTMAFGNLQGSLGNSGELLVLSKPDTVVSTNGSGQPVTNLIHIAVDETTYSSGGRWPGRASGGGSSLEKIDLRADARRATSWAASDETSRGSWVTMDRTATVVLAQGTPNSLQIILLGEGEALVDDVELLLNGTTQLISNQTFTAGMTGWFPQGNQEDSFWQVNGGTGDSGCLHVVATGRGDTGANRIRVPLASSLTNGAQLTFRAKVRWLKGTPEILFRLRGTANEFPASLLTTRTLGTPGVANTAAASNAGPAIWDVTHSPILPQASQPVTVSARVQDPDGLSFLQLRYRLDPSSSYTNVLMGYAGAGFYTATLPAMPAGAVLAYYIEATDAAAAPLSRTFPADAPMRECLVRWGETTNSTSFGQYRIWLTQQTISRWSARERLSNKPLDMTFIHGNSRVIYNAGAQYSGSPFHSPGYDSPIGSPSDYALSFNADDPLLDAGDVNIINAGNGCCDNTLQREHIAYWIAYRMGLPRLHSRHVRLFVNGVQRSDLMQDIQQPNRDYSDNWYPNGAGGNLHKIQLWFEMEDDASTFSAWGASLGVFNGPDGKKNLAYYRFNWSGRAFGDTPNNYTNLFGLMDATATGATGDEYTRQIGGQVDADNWMGIFAFQRVIDNTDSWNYGGGQNMYLYKPLDQKWKLLLWDIDFAFGGNSPSNSVFQFGDSQGSRMANHPPFMRRYVRALRQAALNVLDPAVLNPTIDARYSAFTNGGANPASPQDTKDYIQLRRASILGQLIPFDAPFGLTSPSSFTTNRNEIVLSGTVPLSVAGITVNGIARPISWTTASNWTVQVVLGPGLNTLQIAGVDDAGTPVVGASASAQVTLTAAPESPEGRVVINEIQHNPLTPGTGFVELLNTSSTTSFDLTGWRFEGLGYTFRGGTVLGPGSFLTLVANPFSFSARFGQGTVFFDQFPGGLDDAGETIRLRRPHAGTTNELTVAELTYGSASPWPNGAGATDASLQLIDASKPLGRVGNWGSVSSPTNPPVRFLEFTNQWRFFQGASLDGVNWKDPSFNDAAWPSGPGLLYVEDAPLAFPKSTPLILGSTTYYFRTRFNYTGQVPVGALFANLMVDDGVVLYLNGQEIYRIRMPADTITNATLASGNVADATVEGPVILPAGALVFGTNVLAAEVHQSAVGSSDIVFGLEISTTASGLLVATPSAANSLRAVVQDFPTIWLNEFQPTNTTALRDRFNQSEPWVELLNTGTNLVSLGGLFLTDNWTNLTRWAFPSNYSIGPGQFRLVFLDAEPGQSDASELHASFRPISPAGTLGLVQTTPSGPRVLDYLNYTLPVVTRSFGAFPDGRAAARRPFYVPTPGASNNPAPPPVSVVFNEWMADNTATLRDPADNDYDDWFELYNPADVAADLGGYYLTDALTNKTQWSIPAGTVIPARGRILVWADGEASQNGPGRDLHTNFKLSGSGEALGLFTPDGSLVDAVTFGPQSPDISEGRTTDGAAGIVFMAQPTPGAANYVPPPNRPPVLNPLSNRVITGGRALSFVATATDPDLPGQNLTFSFGTPAPPGATIDPGTGEFTWATPWVSSMTNVPVQVMVSDSGNPSMSATRNFSVALLPRPTMGGLRVTGGELELSFGSQVGFRYRVEYQTFLGQPQWLPLGSDLQATTGQVSIGDQIRFDLPSRFYRVVPLD